MVQALNQYSTYRNIFKTQTFAQKQFQHPKLIIINLDE